MWKLSIQTSGDPQTQRHEPRQGFHQPAGCRQPLQVWAVSPHCEWVLHLPGQMPPPTPPRWPSEEKNFITTS